MRPLDVVAIQHFKTYYIARGAVTGCHVASLLVKAHLKATAAKVAGSELHKTGLFPVKRKSFNELIMGYLPQIGLSNSKKSFVLPFDIGPVPNRLVHRNNSKQQGGLSPRQGTTVLAAGSPHKQILIQEDTK
jgi:hypothetical protein